MPISEGERQVAASPSAATARRRVYYEPVNLFRRAGTLRQAGTEISEAPAGRAVIKAFVDFPCCGFGSKRRLRLHDPTPERTSDGHRQDHRIGQFGIAAPISFG